MLAYKVGDSCRINTGTSIVAGEIVSISRRNAVVKTNRGRKFVVPRSALRSKLTAALRTFGGAADVTVRQRAPASPIPAVDIPPKVEAIHIAGGSNLAQVMAMQPATRCEFEMSDIDTQRFRAQLYHVNKVNTMGARWRTIREGNLLVVVRFY